MQKNAHNILPLQPCWSNTIHRQPWCGSCSRNLRVYVKIQELLICSFTNVPVTHTFHLPASWYKVKYCCSFRQEDLHSHACRRRSCFSTKQKSKTNHCNNSQLHSVSRAHIGRKVPEGNPCMSRREQTLAFSSSPSVQCIYNTNSQLINIFTSEMKVMKNLSCLPLRHIWNIPEIRCDSNMENWTTTSKKITSTEEGKALRLCEWLQPLPVHVTQTNSGNVDILYATS